MPLADNADKSNTVAEDYICSIVEFATNNLRAVTIDELKSSSRENPTIVKLHDLISSGDEWPKRDLSTEIEKYYKIRSELCTYDALVHRGNRIIVPTMMRRRILMIAHETHHGIVRTKKFLRQRFYWIGLDKDVENLVTQ